MFLPISFIVVLSITFVNGKATGCDYTSREYQVVLKTDLFSGANSFASGVSIVLTELEAIENAALLDFKVSRSSLKFKNVAVAKYAAQHAEDLTMKITMKSRHKNSDEPADFVLKFSNADPLLACVPLKLQSHYSNYAEQKFELDFHAVNGKIMTKTAMSYTIDMPPSVKFSQTSPVNLSSVFINSAQKLTHSGRTIIAQPVGQAIQQTAEFDMRLSGKKIKGSITLVGVGEEPKGEFSFRIKNEDINEHILSTAQSFASELSRKTSVALFAGSNAECAE